MKPLRIEMQAFGPYLKRQVLDFRDMGDRQVFLIHGPTGAGKTSLFDAMSYALFGRASGDRPVADMRSKQAPVTLATEVIFDFALGADFYRARRKVDFREIGRGKNKGKLEEEPLAEFMRLRLDEDGQTYVEVEAIASLDTKVTAAVTERVGLGAEQFLQVIILPQGKFRQFLASKSQDREEILQALFKTIEHKRLQERLDAEARALGDRLSNLKAELRGKAGQSGSESVDPTFFAAELASLEVAQKEQSELVLPLRTEFAQIEAELATERHLSKRFADAERAAHALAQLASRKNEIETLENELRGAHRAREIASAEAQKNSEQAQLRSHEDAIPALETAVQSADAAHLNVQGHLAQASHEAGSVAALTIQLETLESVAKKIQDRVRIASKLASDLAALTQLENELKLSERRLNEIETQSLPRAREQVADLKVAADQVTLHEQAQRDLQALKVEAAGLRTLLQETRELSARIETGERKVADQRNLVAMTRVRYEKLDEQLAGNQAVALAHRLVDGEACPVCGSAEHPAKATNSPLDAHGVVDREQVKQAQSEYKIREDELNRYVNKLTEFKAKHESMSESATRARQQLASRGYGDTSGNADFSDGAALDRQIAENATRTEKSRLAQADLPRLTQHLQKLEREVAESQSQIQLRRASIAALARKTAEEQGSLQRIDLDLRESWLRSGTDPLPTTLSELDAKRARLHSEINRLNRALLDAQKSAESAVQRRAATGASLAAKRDEVTAATARWNAARADFLAARLRQGFNDEASFLSAKRDPAWVEATEQALGSYRVEIARNEALREEIAHEIQGRICPSAAAVSLKEVYKTELAGRLELLNQDLGGRQREIVAKRTLVAEITERLLAISKVELTYGELKQLSLVANGHGDNRYNMSFQRYVQAIYFEEVLSAASFHLEKMSGGRYHLKRSEELGRGNTSGGLDLVVEDRAHGTERPASTLSGGEGFMASLALALALSQIVQEGNGAIRMDAIFIDEGFGTLDEESLRRAIDTLMELHKQGRMVGIISHVPELKQVIPAQIEITLGLSGSEIHVRA